MTVTHGSDPERLTAIGEALRAQAGRVEAALQVGSTGLAALVEAWSGPDLEVFGEDWYLAEEQLHGAVGMLWVVGDRACEQAEQQLEASRGEGRTAALAPLVSPTGRAGGAAAPDPASPGIGGGAGLGGDLVGPDIEDLPVPYPPDDDRRWVPQGFSQTDDGRLITSFYDKDSSGDGLLAIQSRDGTVEYVRIGGNDHYGGVTVDGDNVYVSGNGESGDESTIQQYRLDDLVDGAASDADGDVVRPVDTVDAPTGSTVTSHDGTVYAAQHSGGTRGDLYSWSIGPGGRLTPDQAEGEPLGQVPWNTQGVVTDGENWFAVTTTPDTDRLARESSSQVVAFDPETGLITDTITDSASPLSQGVDIIDGQLVMTNEGYADPYRGDSEAAGADPNPNLQAYDIPEHVDTVPDAWPGMFF